MITIALQGAEFFAYHGFYPEEQKLGCRFLVDIACWFCTETDRWKKMNLMKLLTTKSYIIACEEMKQTRMLIETVGQAIVDSIVKQDIRLQKLAGGIKKLNPPLQGKVAFSSCYY
jgi:dihydroneopterin aldolase